MTSQSRQTKNINKIFLFLFIAQHVKVWKLDQYAYVMLINFNYHLKPPILTIFWFSISWTAQSQQPTHTKYFIFLSTPWFYLCVTNYPSLLSMLSCFYYIINIIYFQNKVIAVPVNCLNLYHVNFKRVSSNRAFLVYY